TPTSRIIRPLYKFYAGHIIPLLGRMMSRDVSAYSYLPKSIAAVPQREAMTALMEQVGFADCQWRAFTFGVCCLYTATKPH
ncbi:MAG: class I SAM-dependent methyltransferase, partial [Paramuribaculum sp.]|nr:class I SAM-dependent methyltransferase [Paramuribaculum sp.]